MLTSSITRCPLTYAPPFMPPWKRALCPDTEHRLRSWCEELSGESTHLVEWVGADPRQPIHAVVLSFPSTHRPRVVLYQKSEDLERRHLVAALSAPRPAASRSSLRAAAP